MAERMPCAKRPRYTVERDVEIVFGDEVIQVYSFSLMMASSVFRCMLQSDLQEGNTGRIVLRGKSAAEFKEVLRQLEVFGGVVPPPVRDDNVEMLLRWADEYQMEVISQRCKEFLLQKNAADVSALELAAHFRLGKRVEQCVAAISQNVVSHLTGLIRFVSNEDVMQRLWPALCRLTTLEALYDRHATPYSADPESAPLSSQEKTWPLIVTGMRAMSWVKPLCFNNLSEVESWIEAVPRSERWVLCIGDPTELERLCVSKPKDVGRTCSFNEQKKRFAGKFVQVLGVSESGALSVSDPDGGNGNHRIPYSAVLRPLR